MDTNIKHKYFRKIDVWKRIDAKSLVCFRCYELLGEGRFYVQSSDYFYLPISRGQVELSESQQIELFLEESLTERAISYPTLQDAISAHELELNH